MQKNYQRTLRGSESGDRNGFQLFWSVKPRRSPVGELKGKYKMLINTKTLKSTAKVLGVIILLLVFIIGGCNFLISSFSDGLCGNEIFQEVYSPDHEYKAVVFQRDCGATTSFSTQISILKASAKLPDESGNAFAMDGHPDWAGVKINWETNRLVSIEYAAGYEVFYMKDSVRIFFTSIGIKYPGVSG